MLAKVAEKRIYRIGQNRFRYVWRTQTEIRLPLDIRTEPICLSRTEILAAKNSATHRLGFMQAHYNRMLLSFTSYIRSVEEDTS